MRALTHKAESQYDESETSLAGYNGGERRAHGERSECSNLPLTTYRAEAHARPRHLLLIY